MFGWMGKLLHLGLTKSRLSEIATGSYSEQYIGGRGMASKIYWDNVPSAVKAFDPENYLIFMTGPLVATGAQGASRTIVAGKSPTLYPEGYCYGNIGGFFGAELKKAGYDGISLTGRAENPVYLWVQDGKAEIRDASRLWGESTSHTEEILKQQHGDDVRYVTIGVAGERRVRTAVVFASHQSVSTGGFGAVMGSKNFKGIAVKGSGKPGVANPQELQELNRYTVKLSTRFRSSISPQIRASNHAHLLEEIGKGNCYLCGLDCPRRLMKYGNRLIGYRKCQSMEYYLPWKYDHDEEPLETFFDAPALANDYSLETWDLQHIVEWLHVCYRESCLTEQKTGLPLSKIGTREFLEKLLRSISYREGFGDILAEGLPRAMEKVSSEARSLINPLAASIGQWDAIPSSAIVAHSLLYSMEPRKHPISVHEIIYPLLQWRANQANPKASPVNAEAFLKIATVFWGSEAAADLSGYQGKALAAKLIQDRTCARDSLGLCDFIYPNTFSYNTPDYVGDPDLESKLFSAVTGLDASLASQAGESIFNLQRSILLREGRQTPKDDYPPALNFSLAASKGPARPVIVPGPQGEPVDASKNVIDRDKFNAMLKEYYRLRGWDERGAKITPVA